MSLLEKIADYLDALADERDRAPEVPPAAPATEPSPLDKLATRYFEATGEELGAAERDALAANDVARELVAKLAGRPAGRPTPLGEPADRAGEAPLETSKEGRIQAAYDNFARRMGELGGG